jgi:hypothetical protein
MSNPNGDFAEKMRTAKRAKAEAAQEPAPVPAAECTRAPEASAELPDLSTLAPADLAALPEEQFNRLHAPAIARQHDLDAAFAAASEAARAAEAAYDADVTMENLLAKDRAAKAEREARKARDEHEECVRAVRQEKTRRVQACRLAELKVAMDIRGEVSAVGDQVVAIFDRFAHDMAEQIAQLQGLIARAAAACPEANGLEGRYAWQQEYRVPELGYVVQDIHAQLAKHFGRIEDSGDGSQFARIYHWYPQGVNSRLGTIELQCRIPCRDWRK